MDHADVLSGNAFKAVVRAAMVFLAVIVVMAIFSVRLIDRTLTEQVRQRVMEMAESIGDVAEDDLIPELAERVGIVTRGAAGQTLAYAVFDAGGKRIAGNTNARPKLGEWVEETLTLEAQASSSAAPLAQRFLLHAVPDKDRVLVVGRSVEFIEAAKMAAIRGLALTAFVVILAMLAIGYVLSRRSQNSLEHMEAVLDRVSRGETGARIGVSGNDQIDRIARRMNAHLDLLDDLFRQTRRTAASVAHDLRRPLARATLGMERALARAEDGEDAREEIAASLQDLTHLQSVIGSILRIARIESGEMGRMTPFDLREVLDEVAETFRPVAEDAAQTFRYARADAPLLVLGDREMLAQLAVNLVQNALTHAGDGAAITLSAEANSHGVTLVISDTGPGIPEDLRDRVLDPFFRADAARSLEGSGLGLALVKAIADRHGATLRLEDGAPGLRVRVELPAPETGQTMRVA
jgi:signal transduction histidine kinase